MNNLFYENASVLIIGNEILSGRTIDKNFNYIATKLGEHGISISESRTVSDSEEEIINAINELRKRFKFFICNRQWQGIMLYGVLKSPKCCTIIFTFI